MKYSRFALIAFVSALGLARAEDDQNRAPPTEIPDFSNLDEYVYEPKSVLILGMRRLTGVKASFSGTALILPPEAPGNATDANVFRSYHDGSVGVDARVAARTDGAGNPIIDPITNGQVYDLITPDGHTNTWSYSDPRQGTEMSGMVTFHSATAQITDTTVRTKNALSASGVEVGVQRDMGAVFHTRATWGLLAGVSMNDISAATTDNVKAAITKITDIYSLDGQTLPALITTTTNVLDSSGNAVLNADGTNQTVVTGTTPYSSPSSSTTTVLDPAGNPVLNEDGTTQTVAVDTTTLLSNKPLARLTSTVTDSTSVSSHWKLKGAYFTFRVGPSISIPIGTRFHFVLSAGPALVYAGTEYTITQTFQPEIGSAITNSDTSTTTHLLPAYFADASVQFDLSDHTGIFAGAVLQGSSSYDQKVDTTTDHYLTKVDLTKQQGMRAGMTIRF